MTSWNISTVLAFLYLIKIRLVLSTFTNSVRQGTLSTRKTLVKIVVSFVSCIMKQSLLMSGLILVCLSNPSNTFFLAVHETPPPVAVGDISNDMRRDLNPTQKRKTDEEQLQRYHDAMFHVGDVGWKLDHVKEKLFAANQKDKANAKKAVDEVSKMWQSACDEQTRLSRQSGGQWGQVGGYQRQQITALDPIAKKRRVGDTSHNVYEDLDYTESRFII